MLENLVFFSQRFLLNAYCQHAMQRAVRFIFYLTSLEVKKKNIKPEKGIPHLNIGSDIFSQQVQENAYI